jgi:hypothetical protein
MTVYERFEQVAALVITALVSVLIAAALLHLTWDVLLLVLAGLADPAEKQPCFSFRLGRSSVGTVGGWF